MTLFFLCALGKYERWGLCQGVSILVRLQILLFNLEMIPRNDTGQILNGYDIVMFIS